MRITELFDNGEFVVSAEVGPPKGIHIDGMVEEAKKYLTGVHFVNVTDNQSSVMRLGSLATCKVLKDAGLNPIFQLTCRDRNRIALESDLLSAAMLGIDNILCLTGDHTKLGDHPQAKPVFDLDSVSLLYARDPSIRIILIGGSSGQIRHGKAFAFFIMAMIPILILYLCMQKYIVSGITAGAVKG